MLKRLWCRLAGHDWNWVRGIYGDEIMACGYRRNLFECTRCGAMRPLGKFPLEPAAAAHRFEAHKRG